MRSAVIKTIPLAKCHTGPNILLQRALYVTATGSHWSSPLGLQVELCALMLKRALAFRALPRIDVMDVDLCRRLLARQTLSVVTLTD